MGTNGERGDVRGIVPRRLQGFCRRWTRWETSWDYDRTTPCLKLDNRAGGNGCRSRYPHNIGVRYQAEVRAVYITNTTKDLCCDYGVWYELRSHLNNLRLFEPIGVLELTRVLVLMSSKKVK